MPFEEYLSFLYERLAEMHRTLRPSGSLYLHLDWHAVHHARLMLDEIFGADRFLNEIIWAYDYGGRARDKWARKHDNILWYGKSASWTYNRDDIDRIPYLAPDLVGPEKAARGKLPTDVWWITIVPTNSRERTGYPTQKPLKLVERIVRASSNEGDLVADFFVGSGTTAVAAARNNRRFPRHGHQRPGTGDSSRQAGGGHGRRRQAARDGSVTGDAGLSDLLAANEDAQVEMGVRSTASPWAGSPFEWLMVLPLAASR